MPDAAETVELRALQARAYGRGGDLTDADVQRLRELEEARPPGLDADPVDPADPAEQPASVPAHPPLAAAADASRPDPAVAAAAAASRFAEAEGAPATRQPQSPQRESARAAVRRHWRLALGALLAVSVLGIGIGWLLFADRGPAGMPLTAEQQDWQNALIASGDFDSGSLRALREQEGVVIWFATKRDGDQVCLVLADADESIPACTTREQALVRGVSTTFVKPVDDSRQYRIDAQLYLSDEGEPAVVARSYTSASPVAGNMFASEEEAVMAASLVEAGLDPGTVEVAGYDDEVPVWVGLESETQRFCLVVDAGAADPIMACDGSLLLSDGSESLVLERPQPNGDTTRYEYHFGNGQQYLTVTKEIGDDDAARG